MLSVASGEGRPQDLFLDTGGSPRQKPDDFALTREREESRGAISTELICPCVDLQKVVHVPTPVLIAAGEGINEVSVRFTYDPMLESVGRLGQAAEGLDGLG